MVPRFFALKTFSSAPSAAFIPCAGIIGLLASAGYSSQAD